jgi:hypothetical protein
MTHKDGILSALDTSISLEDKIRASLDEVVSNHRPRDRYPDREDKHNVVQRELIVTTLEAIFEHHSEQLKSDEEGATVQTSESPDPFIELFSAFRNLRHDTERLNEGLDAERVAKPVVRESITENDVIPINRRIRILWYAASELYCTSDQDLFPTQGALQQHAARILDSTPGSLKTGHSQLKSKGRAIERALFYKIINDCRQLSKEDGGGISPLRILLPALEVLSSD